MTNPDDNELMASISQMVASTAQRIGREQQKLENQLTREALRMMGESEHDPTVRERWGIVRRPYQVPIYPENKSSVMGEPDVWPGTGVGTATIITPLTQELFELGRAYSFWIVGPEFTGTKVSYRYGGVSVVEPLPLSALETPEEREKRESEARVSEVISLLSELRREDRLELGEYLRNFNEADKSGL